MLLLLPLSMGFNPPADVIVGKRWTAVGGARAARGEVVPDIGGVALLVQFVPSPPSPGDGPGTLEPLYTPAPPVCIPSAPPATPAADTPPVLLLPLLEGNTVTSTSTFVRSWILTSLARTSGLSREPSTIPPGVGGAVCVGSLGVSVP